MKNLLPDPVSNYPNFLVTRPSIIQANQNLNRKVPQNSNFIFILYFLSKYYNIRKNCDMIVFGNANAGIYRTVFQIQS